MIFQICGKKAIAFMVNSYYIYGWHLTFLIFITLLHEIFPSCLFRDFEVRMFRTRVSQPLDPAILPNFAF